MMKRIKIKKLLRWPDRLMRLTGSVLLAAYLVSVADPVLANVRAANQMAAMQKAAAPGATGQLAQQLIALEEMLDRLQRRLQGRHEFEWQEILARGGRAAPAPPAALRPALAVQEHELAALAGTIETLLPQARNELAAPVGENAALPPEILLRQVADRMSFEEGAARLASDLAAIRNARSEGEFAAAVSAARQWLMQHSSQPARAPFDPDKLAFGPQSTSVRAPAETPAALQRVFAGDVVATTDFASAAGIKDGPGAGDLAPTEDVQLSAAIRAKSQELGPSPLALFRYVHDHVQFVPSYGSIQGSDYTLQTQRGNAFDQASLLIALLRAANIPARYVYGTIEVPVDKVMNWVGGVSEPRAALSLLAQGGIPSVGMAQGGIIKHVRLEHVWVEAWSNQFPGGGVRGGSGDQWVALDPSFKQHEFSVGMQVLNQVGYDTAGVVGQALDGAVTNEAEGWVQNLDLATVAEADNDFRKRLHAHVAAAGADTTVADVIGSWRIRPSELRGLPSGLPYRVTAQDSAASALPEHLRWKFRFEVGQLDPYIGEFFADATLLDRSLPSLAGKALAMSFRPATPSDAATLNGYLPANLNAQNLPRRLPANIVQLVTEFSLDGQPVTTGPVYGLGSELATRKGFYIPGIGWSETDNPHSAGDYQAVGIDLHGVSMTQASRNQSVLLGAKAKLDAGISVDPHETTGAVLQAAALSYFAETHAAQHVAGRMTGVLGYRLPSYGTVSIQSSVQYVFGVPRFYRPAGMLMDMDRIAGSVAAVDGSARKLSDFLLSSGRIFSTLEHRVLETALSLPESPSSGVSAVKLIDLAGRAGQRLYRIDAANSAVALAALSLPAQVKNDIAGATMAGKIVRTHQAPLTPAGHGSVAGYVVLDLDSGAASYLLSNGADGGSVVTASDVFIAAIALLGIAIIGAAAFFAGFIASVVVVAIAASLAINLLLLLMLADADINWDSIENRLDYIIGLVIGTVSLVVSPVAAAILFIIAAMIGLGFAI